MCFVYGINIYESNKSLSTCYDLNAKFSHLLYCTLIKRSKSCLEPINYARFRESKCQVMQRSQPASIILWWKALQKTRRNHFLWFNLSLFFLRIFCERKIIDAEEPSKQIARKNLNYPEQKSRKENIHICENNLFSECL